MQLLKDISNFNKLQDYLPILNSAIFADLVILFILYYTPYFQSNFLKQWYETYRLSAVIADVLILVIGIILARILYKYLFNEFTPFKFIIILVGIQVIHDILFYGLFKSVPIGVNKMLDLFKSYANEVSYKAILGDSFMIIICGLMAMYFAGLNLHSNILILITLVYLIPYIIYTK